MTPDITEQSEKCSLFYQQYRNIVDSNKVDICSRVFHSRANGQTDVSLNPVANIDGAKIKKGMIHLGSYNYSGLNSHPAIIEAAQDALLRYGTTSSGVRLLNGTFDVHLTLEERLAKFIGHEACMTFSSGYAANMSVLGALCGPDDIVFSDQLNHQSIKDGLKLSGAHVVTFKHASMKHLEQKLNSSPSDKRKIIVTDGVFSMDGDIANLPEITKLANKYNAFVIVDDAHGVAAVGPNGRGTVAHFGLEYKVDVVIGSLSKGLPGIGGFVVASQRTIETLFFGANSYVFSASLPPVIVGGLIEAIYVLMENPDIQNSLHENENYLREELQKLGFDTMGSCTPIIPILMPDTETAYACTRELHNQGVYVNPVTAPAVSRKLTRLRLNVSACLSREDLNKALKAFENIIPLLNRSSDDVNTTSNIA